MKCCVRRWEITCIVRCLNYLVLLLAGAVLQLHQCFNLLDFLVQSFLFIVRCSEYLLVSFGIVKRNVLPLDQKVKVL